MTPACADDAWSALDTGVDTARVGLEVPCGESLPPLAYSLAPTYADTDPWFPYPETIQGHIYLTVDPDGLVSGTISAGAGGAVSLTPVGGQVKGSELALEVDTVPVAPGGLLGLAGLTLALVDEDGDGVIEGAEGVAAGSWQMVVGDVVDQTTYTGTFTAGPDLAATGPVLLVERNLRVVLPYEPVHVRFEEPLRAAEVRKRLRLRADGELVPARVTAAATGGLVVEAELEPELFLPFAAELTLDVSGLEDPSGNDLLALADGVPVAADPGALGSNTGFEAGLDGWIAVGLTSAEGVFQGVSPVEGVAQGVARQGSTLAAAIDVPTDATELEISVAVLTEGWQVDADHTAVITLYGPAGAATEIFDVADVADQLEDCTACTEYGAVVGPLRRSVDLEPHRGRRVFVAVDVRSSFFFGVNFFAAVVDDLQVR